MQLARALSFFIVLRNVNGLFFREARLNVAILASISQRFPINVGRSDADERAGNVGILKDIIDRGVIEFMGRTAARSYNEYSTNNPSNSSLLKTYLSQMTSGMQTIDSNHIFPFLGVHDKKCQDKIICEVNELLVNQDSYKSRFMLWLIKRHFPLIGESMTYAENCSSARTLNCKQKFGSACSNSLSNILNLFGLQHLVS